MFYFKLLNFYFLIIIFICKFSKILIDLVIHNQNTIIETVVIGCPFSDQCIVISSLEFYSTNEQKSASNTG